MAKDEPLHLCTEGKARKPRRLALRKNGCYPGDGGRAGRVEPVEAGQAGRPGVVIALQYEAASAPDLRDAIPRFSTVAHDVSQA